MSIKTVLKKLSPIHIVALVCAVLIFAAVVTSAVFFGIGLANDAKKEFDFTKNPEKYIEINYKQAFEISPEYTALREVDIDHKILGLVAGEKNKNSGVKSEYDANTVINVGDEVKIYYRGYTGEGDERKAFDGGCNFIGISYAALSAYTLAIGGDNFIAGFSLGLDGKKVGDFPVFVRERDVEVTTSYIAFVSYTRYPVTYNKYSGVETVGTVDSGTSVYMDLSGDLTVINDSYGEGFTKYLLGNGLAADADGYIAPAVADGDNLITDIRLTNAEGVEYKYTKIAVEYVMAADYYTNKDTNEKYDTIKVQFPENYGSADLAGQNAEFEVLIESVKEYGYDYEGTCDMTNADFVDAMLKKALEDEEEVIAKVEALEGDTFRAKYENYLKADNAEDNKLTNTNAKYQKIIDALVAASSFNADNYDEIKSYVDAKYDASVITFLDSYASNGSSYASVEAYAEDVLDLTGDEYYTAVGEGEDAVKVYDWHKALRTLAENYYKERLIVHYIIAEEGLADGYDAAYAAVCEEYSAAYRVSYAKQQGIDLDNMTEKEAKQVRDAVNTYLAGSAGYDFLTERAYYQLVLDWYTTGAGAQYVVEN